MLAGVGLPLAGNSRAHRRWQHTEAAGRAEVDLRRLEEGDDGREEEFMFCNIVSIHSDKKTPWNDHTNPVWPVSC